MLSLAPLNLIFNIRFVLKTILCGVEIFPHYTTVPNNLIILVFYTQYIHMGMSLKSLLGSCPLYKLSQFSGFEGFMFIVIFGCLLINKPSTCE